MSRLKIYDLATASFVYVGGIDPVALANDAAFNNRFGTVGYAEAVANQGSITSVVDLTGLTVTFTAIAGKRYKITGNTFPQSSVVNDSAQAHITDGSNNQVGRSDSGALPVANIPQGVIVLAVVTPSPGSVTYKIRMVRSGTGTVQNNASATFPSFILVEAIGV